MGRTKEQARQWLIRKLGGYVEPPIVRTEYRHVRSDLEHLRHKLLFTKEESSYGKAEFDAIQRILTEDYDNESV